MNSWVALALTRSLINYACAFSHKTVHTWRTLGALLHMTPGCGGIPERGVLSSSIHPPNNPRSPNLRRVLQQQPPRPGPPRHRRAIHKPVVRGHRRGQNVGGNDRVPAPHRGGVPRHPRDPPQRDNRHLRRQQDGGEVRPTDGSNIGEAAGGWGGDETSCVMRPPPPPPTPPRHSRKRAVLQIRL